jgi:hypothetical protein
VVTIIPAPSDQPASPLAVQPAGPLPPIELGSAEPSPSPVATAAAKSAASTSGSDRLTRLVRLLLVGALLLGIGGGAGLYLTRSAR